MRSYIRHPSDVPIDVRPDQGHTHAPTQQLKNVSHGGLSFISKHPQEIGSTVTVRIPFVTPVFEATGKIRWCKPVENAFEIGFEFLDEHDEFKSRMVEQICHIEHYKNEVLLTEGRVLTGHEAAIEWIAKYASQFPFADPDEDADEQVASK